MEKIVKKLIEAENKAHELIEKARLDKDWAVQLHQKEFNNIKKNRYSELNSTLTSEIEKAKSELETEYEALTQKHVEEKQMMSDKYSQISEQLLTQLFNAVTKV